MIQPVTYSYKNSRAWNLKIHLTLFGVTIKTTFGFDGVVKYCGLR